MIARELSLKVRCDIIFEVISLYSFSSFLNLIDRMVSHSSCHVMFCLVCTILYCCSICCPVRSDLHQTFHFFLLYIFSSHSFFSYIVLSFLIIPYLVHRVLSYLIISHHAFTFTEKSMTGSRVRRGSFSVISRLGNHFKTLITL